MTNKVVLAPDCIYEFIDRSSVRHGQAVAFFRYFAEQRYKVFLDTISLNETYDEIYRKMSQDLARDFLKIVTLSDINLVVPDEADTKAAMKALLNYPSIEVSFSQTVRSVIANRRNINQIATFKHLPPLFGIEAFYLPI